MRPNLDQAMAVAADSSEETIAKALFSSISSYESRDTIEQTMGPLDLKRYLPLMVRYIEFADFFVSHNIQNVRIRRREDTENRVLSVFLSQFPINEVESTLLELKGLLFGNSDRRQIIFLDNVVAYYAENCIQPNPDVSILSIQAFFSIPDQVNILRIFLDCCESPDKITVVDIANARKRLPVLPYKKDPPYFHNIIHDYYREMIDNVLYLISIIKGLTPNSLSQLTRLDAYYLIERIDRISAESCLELAPYLREYAFDKVHVFFQRIFYLSTRPITDPHLNEISTGLTTMLQKKPQDAGAEVASFQFDVGYDSHYCNHPSVIALRTEYLTRLGPNVLPHQNTGYAKKLLSRAVSFGAIPRHANFKNFIGRQNRTLLFRNPRNAHTVTAIKVARDDESNQKLFSEATVIHDANKQKHLGCNLPKPICCHTMPDRGGGDSLRQRFFPYDKENEFHQLMRVLSKERPNGKLDIGRRQDQFALYVYEADFAYFERLPLISNRSIRCQAAVRNVFATIELLKPAYKGLSNKPSIQIALETGIQQAEWSGGAYDPLEPLLRRAKPGRIIKAFSPPNVEGSDYRKSGIADLGDVVNPAKILKSVMNLLLGMSLQLAVPLLKNSFVDWDNSHHQEEWITYGETLVFLAAQMTHQLTGMPLTYAYQYLAERVNVRNLARESLLWMSTEHASYINDKRPLPEEIYGKDVDISMPEDDYTTTEGNVLGPKSYTYNPEEQLENRVIGVWGGVDPRVTYQTLACEMSRLIITGADGQVLYRYYCREIIRLIESGIASGVELEELQNKAYCAAPWSKLHEKLPTAKNRKAPVPELQTRDEQSKEFFSSRGENVAPVVSACYQQFVACGRRKVSDFSTRAPKAAEGYDHFRGPTPAS